MKRKWILFAALTILITFTIAYGAYQLVFEDGSMHPGECASTTFTENSTEANIKIELLNYYSLCVGCPTWPNNFSDVRVVITDGPYTLLDKTYHITDIAWHTYIEVISVARGPQMSLTVTNSPNSDFEAVWVKVSKEDW
jgi:hypothetical protein